MSKIVEKFYQVEMADRDQENWTQVAGLYPDNEHALSVAKGFNLQCEAIKSGKKFRAVEITKKALQ